MILGQFWLSMRTSFVAVTKPEDVKPKTSRYAIDLLPHRTRITIDVDVSQTPACCFSTTAIPAASTIASAPLPP